MYRTLINIIGAICLIVGPLGEIFWSLLWPGGSAAPAKDNVAAIVADPSGASAGIWFDLAIILLIPAALFVGRALQSGVRVLAGVGTVLLFLGSLVFTYSLGGDAVLLSAAQHGGVTTAQGYFDSPVVGVATLLGIALQFVGVVLLGISALRSRLIPIWAGILLIIWNPVQAVGTAAGVPALEAIGNVMLLAAYAACAVRLFRPAVARERRSEPVLAADTAR
jgi:hypothetical protein